MRKPLLLLLFLLVLSCKKEHATLPPPKTYPNILILGNSITLAPEDDSIGWFSSRGMAASVPEKDYVHLLTAKFLQQNPKSITIVKNIASFERDCVNYDFDTELKTYRDSKPDILILRVGENVPDGFDAVVFDKRYTDLINYFTAANPDIKIYAFGSFWTGKDAVNAIMKKHSDFVSLSILGVDDTNYSFGLFDNFGIQLHPGDKGMQAIADMIWQEIEPLFNNNGTAIH